jgi:hypothetical protein
MKANLTKIGAAVTGLATNIIALGNVFHVWDVTSDQMAAVVLVLGNMFALAMLFVAVPTIPPPNGGPVAPPEAP